MNTNRVVVIVAFLFALSFAAHEVHAQQPQIPTLQVCNQTKVSGQGTVKIASRMSGALTGTFVVKVEIKCDPQTNGGYPTGTLEITNISMFDSIVQGTITATTFEQITSTGKYSPTAYLNGRCKTGDIIGCRYWIMFADNKEPNAQGTPDVIGFLVFDGKGQRIAYGTGPLSQGDIDVGATGN